MIYIQTASRLHFGLLNLRRYGGVGLMVERPCIRLRAEPAKSWSSVGPLSERALAFALQFAKSIPSDENLHPPCQLIIEEAPPEHVGLGTGTQLGLAVGCSLAAIWGLEMSVAEIAHHIGRGQRSALGVHGFQHGGFLVEGGQTTPGKLGTLVARCVFPSDWRIVLVRPTGLQGIHGPTEQMLMDQLTDSNATDALCRLVLLGMLPALVEEDIDAFGEALFDYNARAGEMFASIQGGIYASPAVAELVAFIRSRGVRGVGQSSWGPTVFAVVASEGEAEELALSLRSKLETVGDILVTRAAAGGVTVIHETSPSSPD